MTDKKFYAEDSARFAAAIEKLKGQKVAVLGHQRPDGDCVAPVAAVRVLMSLGVEAIGLNATPRQRPLSFVGGTPMALAADFTLMVTWPYLLIALTSSTGDRLNELFLKSR